MEALRKNEIYDCAITGLTSEAMGVGRINGQAVFVRGALPGELWRVKIVKAGKTVAYGRGEEYLSPSPDRVSPGCPAYGRCGGCSCRHMSYECELAFKLGKVNDALRRIGGADKVCDGILGSEDTERYRNKAIYAIGGSAAEPVYGFFRANSHDVVGVEGCLLQSESADRCAAAVCGWMRRYGVEPYDVKSGSGSVRHVFTRTARDGSAVCCVVSAGGFGAKTQPLVDALRAACPELKGVVLCVNRTRGNTVLAGDFHTLWGEPDLTDTLCGFEFEIAPQAFYQVNPPQAERLYRRAVELALPEPGGTVLELYCGAGTISLALAARAKRVIGAEIVPEAVENARANAQRNGVKNVEFICADAAEAAARFAGEGGRPDVIVVDPPRKGMSAEALDAVASMQPERIVYVSCDPATLARDIARLRPHGYLAERATAVDMFPRTAHVETVMLLCQQKPDDYIDVELGLDELDATSVETRSTYREIRVYVREHSGLNVSNLYISQVKRKLGLEVGESYNKPKSQDAKVPVCPQNKELAIIDALKHFNMV